MIRLPPRATRTDTLFPYTTLVRSDGSITHYGHEPGDPDSLPSDTVMSLAFDRAGTLWVGTRAGLAKFQGGRIQRVAMPIEGTPLLYSTSLIGDDLWVGTAQGVYVRAPDGRWSQPEDRKSTRLNSSH